MKRLRRFRSPCSAWLRKSATLLGFAFVLRPAAAFPLASSYQGATIQNGPDPSITVVKREKGETHYYMDRSNGPLNDKDRDQNGTLKIHLLPIFHSTDLVNWKYLGDVFQQRPEWAGAARLIGPEIQRSQDKYFLYYTAVDEDEQGNGRTGGAIGVATSASPAGPWADSGQQVVEVQNGRWVYDPFVIGGRCDQRARPALSLLRQLCRRIVRAEIIHRWAQHRSGERGADCAARSLRSDLHLEA